MLLTKTKLLNSRNLSSISHSISSRYLKVLLRIILNVTNRIRDLLPAYPYIFEVILINEGMCLEYYVNLLHFFIFYFIWMMANLPFMMTDVFCMVSHSIKLCQFHSFQLLTFGQSHFLSSVCLAYVKPQYTMKSTFWIE